MSQTKTLQAFLISSILLFFIQGLRVVFSVLFGIIYDQVFEGPINAWFFVSNVLVLATFLTPVLMPRQLKAKWLVVFAILAAISRVSLTINDASIRYWGSLATITFGGLYLTGVLQKDRSMFVSGLLGGLALDQLLRIAGHSYDISLQQDWLAIQIIWVALLTFLAFWLDRRLQAEQIRNGGIHWLDGLAFGGFLFLETSLLTLPNGIARWTDIPYPPIAPILLAGTILPLFPNVFAWIWRFCLSKTIRNGLAVILVFGLLIGYFLQGAIPAFVLFACQLAALALFICTFGDSSDKPHPSGRFVALGLLFLLLLTFFNAFAFTYPYVLPVMRGLGWVVYLVAALMVALRIFLREVPEGEATLPGVDPVVVGILTLTVLAVAIILVWPQPATPLPQTGTLRAATYNIHYGYDHDWHFMLEEMAQTIRAENVDVIALQEVDTGRITSYSVDDALYLAQRLRMNVAYLPTVEHLTGIALLYRGPLAQVEQRLLTSLQEQTGIVGVRLSVFGRSLHAYGIWLGLSNEDTGRQISEALAFIGLKSPATFGGDFNSEPGRPELEAVEEAGFVDPFVALDIVPAPPTSPALNPKSRIDYVWLRGLKPYQAWVSDSVASDHRMVVVEVEIR